MFILCFIGIIVYLLCEKYVIERFPTNYLSLLDINEPVNIFKPFILIIPFTLFMGGLNRTVYITEKQVTVKYMLGALKKTFEITDLQYIYSNDVLYNPSGPALYNEHIKLFNNHKSTIIYACGTSKFESLLEEIQKIAREPEAREEL